MLFADALAEVGIGDPAGVYWAARASLVHRPEDVALFDAVFVAYWGDRTPGMRWRPPQEPVPVTLEVDDPEAIPADAEPGPAGADVVSVRYSATEILGAKDFADYSDEELEEARRLMARIRFDGPARPSRRRPSAPGWPGPARHATHRSLGAEVRWRAGAAAAHSHGGAAPPAGGAARRVGVDGALRPGTHPVRARGSGRSGAGGGVRARYPAHEAHPRAVVAGSRPGHAGRGRGGGRLVGRHPAGRRAAHLQRRVGGVGGWPAGRWW